MKKNTVFCKKLAAVFMSVSMGLFCACSTDNQVPEYRIQAGVARVSGTVSGWLPFEINEQTEKIALSTNNPLIAYDIQYDATIQADGTFVLDVPVACAHLGYIRFDFYEGFIYLSPGDETRLDIAFNKQGKKPNISMLSTSRFTTEDMTNSVNVMLEFFTNPPRGSGTAIIQPEEFSRETMEKIEKMKAMVKRHPELSEAAEQFVTNSLKLMYVVDGLFAYEESMRTRYKDANEGANVNDFTPVTPEKSYYACLKQFDLNNSAYLFCDYYFMAMQAILSDAVLNIPPIGDTPIPDWLKEVKAIIADYIGADTGLFYDVLAANAYSKQFNDEKPTPLSDKQKENIRHYYTENTSFAEILFARNKDLAQ